MTSWGFTGIIILMTNKLYIFCGIPFSGKSTLTKEIAKQKGYARIDLDEVKFRLYGNGVEDAGLQQKDWDTIYQATYKEVEAALKAGQTVIHDTGNFTKYERNLVRQIARKLNVEATTVFVNTPEGIARERLIANRQTSVRFNVTDKEFEEAVAEMEPPGESESHFSYVHGTPVDLWLEKYFS
jgi:predicted kinase